MSSSNKKLKADDYLQELANQSGEEWLKSLITKVFLLRAVPDKGFLNDIYKNFLIEHNLSQSMKFRTSHSIKLMTSQHKQSLGPASLDQVRDKQGKANTTLKRKVFVAMSGGVDSSVAALLLKKEGYDVTGVFMRCYNIDGCSEKDAEDARRVAGKIGIPFYVWDFEEEYKKRVVDYMIAGYKQGITPNPDVMCNKEIKFGIFFDRAMRMGADYVATGHYVRLGSRENLAFLNHASRTPAARSLQSSAVGRPDGTVGTDQAQPPASVSEGKIFSLEMANDVNKDQSYFLWTLTQDKLQYCLFPIGEYLKSEVREIARKAGLPTAEKKDSQGICFLGRVRLGDFLREYIEPKVGQVRLARGDGSYEIIGEHAGAHFYTVGQRHGVGNLKHQKGNTIHAPVYVAEKDIVKNEIVVAEGRDNDALYCSKVILGDVNFITSKLEIGNCPDRKAIADPRLQSNREKLEIPVYARVRYRQPLAQAKLEKSEIRNPKSEIYQLIFAEPQKFVAPGQSAVFYRKCQGLGVRGHENYEMLGGGVIVEAE